MGGLWAASPGPFWVSFLVEFRQRFLDFEVLLVFCLLLLGSFPQRRGGEVLSCGRVDGDLPGEFR